jgi:hypothetical protein
MHPEKSLIKKLYCFFNKLKNPDGIHMHSFYGTSKTHVAAMWMNFLSFGAKRKEDGVEEKVTGWWALARPHTHTSYHASMLLYHSAAALKCPGHEVLR